MRVRLPRITGDRYVDVLVDPGNLAVEVRPAGGGLRSAELLSHATAEQIYLLLRVALAGASHQRRDVCPVLLDDVTTQTAQLRTAAALGLLHARSATPQVVMFSQEAEVGAWARLYLTEPRGQLIELDPALIAP